MKPIYKPKGAAEYGDYAITSTPATRTARMNFFNDF